MVSAEMKLSLRSSSVRRKNCEQNEAIRRAARNCIHLPEHVVVFAVKKRIDRTQARLDKLSNQELLLEAGRALRIEKDRQKELESQLEQQTQAIQRATTVNDNVSTQWPLIE